MQTQNVTVVGAQWGDEGKGKVVDWLSARADLVVRFQGGNNAGHTLVVDGVEHRLSLLPSAVVRQDKQAVIGSGVVLNPWAFLDEVQTLTRHGITLAPDRLAIAETASLVLPLHARVDAAREAARGREAIGTTGRGIGPAYEDRVGRRAVRLADLRDATVLRERLRHLLHHNNALLGAFGESPEDEGKVCDALLEVAPKILPYAADVPALLREAVAANKRILFEGAQGALLDLASGTYPYVTSSHTLAAQAALGSGAPLASLGTVLGIAKAYATRVGSGPFPTEDTGTIGQRLGTRGAEFGTVTGRQRRCGWLDAVALRYAAEVSDLDGIVLTKLDVLDGLETLKIATAYENLAGKTSPFASGTDLHPVYETLEGWHEITHGLTREEDLPAAARGFIARLEELIGVPVLLVSTGAEREAMIVRDGRFAS